MPECLHVPTGVIRKEGQLLRFMKNLFAFLLLHAIPLIIAQMNSYSILHFDFYLCNVCSKKKPLFLYFCLESLAALYNPCNSANRNNNTTKHKEVFKTQCTESTCSCKGFVINGLAKGIVPSDTIFYRCKFEGFSLKAKLPLKEEGIKTTLCSWKENIL